MDGQTDVGARELRIILIQDCSFCASSTSLWHCHATAAGACEFESLGRAQRKGRRCVSKWKEIGRSNFSELLVMNQIHGSTPWNEPLLNQLLPFKSILIIHLYIQNTKRGNPSPLHTPYFHSHNVLRCQRCTCLQMSVSGLLWKSPLFLCCYFEMKTLNLGSQHT